MLIEQAVDMTAELYERDKRLIAMYCFINAT